MSNCGTYYGTPSQRLLRPTKRLAQQAGLVRAARPRRILIVAGVQRSGTELVMDMLDTHWRTDVYHEWDERAFDNYHMRPLPEVEARIAASPSRRIIIKALLEADQLPILLQRFTPARALWMLRDYRDSVNSMLRSFPGAGLRQMQRLRQSHDGAGWRSRGMSETTYRELLAQDHADLGDAEGHALFWWYRNRLFFDQGLDRDPRVVVMRYEDLARAPKPQCQRICDLAGINATARMRHMPHAGSVGKRPPPPLAAGIRQLCDEMAAQLGAVADRHAAAWTTAVESEH
ncbi:MAG: sulfotransferase domain-containing protein [Thiohalocapsa sp.]|jgi:hypothetical protein|uniref:sulfotransferase domain-containing protein n=1 Tax=Thiohalocapsa sp. TaxID=2497641 RepID=UPI0025ECD2BE|nr:sulfotransferase domain-containing protein [Thiohalocapsa sp.]MCG6939708.1 sulfotransferase domain-containing protein [Thiohalocapsa sp.]